ncbi:MAG: hypothetical protein ACYC99_17190 [Candidatus Geothermincolia bacterium]
MHCPYCGAVNPDGAAFCNLCTNRFDGATTPQGQPAAEYPQQQQQSSFNQDNYVPPGGLGDPQMLSPADACNVRYEPSTGKSRGSWQFWKIVVNICLLLVIVAAVVAGILIYQHFQPGAKYAGKYVYEGNQADVMMLNKNGTFEITGEVNVKGKYSVSGTTLTLTLENMPDARRATGTINGTVLTDPDGERWLKQP